MKKITLKSIGLFALSLLATNTFAQTWQANGTDIETSPTTNNVIINNNLGLGTSNIYNRLNINGDIGFDIGATGARHIFGRNPNHGLAIFGGSSWVDGAGMIINGVNSTSTNPGAIDFVANAAGIPPDSKAFTFWMDWNTITMTMNKLGNVGIGTEASDQRLNINGDISFHPDAGTNPNTTTTHRRIFGKSSNYGLAVMSDDNWFDGSGILMNGRSASNNPGGIDFVATSSVNFPSESAFSFWTSNGQGNFNQLPLMQIAKDGQVMIGEAPYVISNKYLLYVETGILTEKVKVATVTGGNWSDYVFAEDYKLKTLAEVKTFIAKNKHLPDVPSAEDVVNNGYDVSQMDATLLQKIEELTLYIIELKAEVDALKNKSSNN